MLVEIVARTRITGMINGEAFNGNVVATLDPDRGGRSKCEFSKLPRGFNPAVFGTQT